EPIYEQRSEREPNALLKLFGLGQRRKVQVGCKLFRRRDHRPISVCRSSLYGDQAACSLACGFGARISTVPPAFSTAAMADFEAPYTENATLALISPEPRSRIPSLARRMMPALTSAITSTLAAGSSVPASIPA